MLATVVDTQALLKTVAAAAVTNGIIVMARK